MSAVIVDTTALLKMIYASLLAGVGVCTVFAIAIFGVTRAGEERRRGRGGVALALATVGALALAVSLAAVVYGVVLVGHKS
jgi:hypothetical protein